METNLHDIILGLSSQIPSTSAYVGGGSFGIKLIHDSIGFISGFGPIFITAEYDGSTCFKDFEDAAFGRCFMVSMVPSDLIIFVSAALKSNMISQFQILICENCFEKVRIINV